MKVDIIYIFKHPHCRCGLQLYKSENKNVQKIGWKGGATTNTLFLATFMGYCVELQSANFKNIANKGVLPLTRPFGHIFQESLLHICVITLQEQGKKCETKWPKEGCRQRHPFLAFFCASFLLLWSCNQKLESGNLEIVAERGGGVGDNTPLSTTIFDSFVWQTHWEPLGVDSSY